MNSLNGTIPQSLFNLTLLQTWYFDSNAFSGTLPDLFGSLIHLKFLYPILFHCNESPLGVIKTYEM